MPKRYSIYLKDITDLQYLCKDEKAIKALTKMLTPENLHIIKDNYYSPAKLSKILACKTKIINDLITDNKLRACKFWNSYRITWEDILYFLWNDFNTENNTILDKQQIWYKDLEDSLLI